MAIFNLLEIWENRSLPEHIKEKPTTITNLDDQFFQSSFEFTEPVCIGFVKSFKSGNPVATYNDLEELQLNDDEKAAVDTTLQELRKNPKFYDGDHILISGVYYDDQENTVHIEAKRVPYSVLRTLALKKFPAGSEIYNMSLYKTGVLVPFVTKDNHTFFMERKADKLFSAASGFLEPIGPEKALSDTARNRDLVEYTAVEESLEEFLEDSNRIARLNFSLPNVMSLSFRKTETGIGTAEFIAPISLSCRKGEFEHLLNTNQARDKSEHTGSFSSVPLDPTRRGEAVEFLSSKHPGGFLYHPMLVSTSRLANQAEFPGFVLRTLPHSRTSIIPMSSLSPHPSAWTIRECQRQEDKKSETVHTV